MYERILVAVDGSDTSKRALAHAIRLAQSEHARLLAVFVIEYPSMIYDSDFIDIGAFHDGLVAQARRVLDKAQQQMAQSEVAGETKIVDSAGVGGSVAQDIRDAAAEFHTDIVVMGTHGRRGFQRLVLGSVAEAYLRLSVCPVLLVPLTDAKPERKR